MFLHQEDLARSYLVISIVSVTAIFCLCWSIWPICIRLIAAQLFFQLLYLFVVLLVLRHQIKIIGSFFGFEISLFPNLMRGAVTKRLAQLISVNKCGGLQPGKLMCYVFLTHQFLPNIKQFIEALE